MRLRKRSTLLCLRLVHAAAGNRNRHVRLCLRTYLDQDEVQRRCAVQPTHAQLPALLYLCCVIRQMLTRLFTSARRHLRRKRRHSRSSRALRSS